MRGINAVLISGRILFIGENHLDYFNLGLPSGQMLVKFITEYIYEDIIFFTKSNLSGSFGNFPMILLDRSMDIKNFMFYQSVFLIISLIEGISTPRDLAMKQSFVDLFFYDNFDITIWSKFSESGISESEYKIQTLGSSLKS